MAEHNELGKYGEEAAGQYLISKGYTILARDWRYGRSLRDIDIIAKSADETTIVFVEVKTRRPNELIPAMKAIDRRKLHNISNAANRYIKMYRIVEKVRFDAIIVHVERYTNKTSIEHYENIYNPINR